MYTSILQSILKVQKMDYEATNVFGVLKHFTALLTENFPHENKEAVASRVDKLYAEKLYDSLLEIIDEFKPTSEDVLFIDDTIQNEAENSEKSRSSQTSVDDETNDDDYEYVSPSTRREPVKISRKRKHEIIELWRRHPKWKWSTLRTKGAPEIPDRVTLFRWRKQVEDKESRLQILNEVNNYAFDKFNLCRQDSKIITSSHLRVFALEKFKLLQPRSNFKFKAGSQWLTNFKRRFNISSRKVTHLITRREIQNEDSLRKSCESFRASIKLLSQTYSPMQIYNTDQCGFAYELVPSRTLTIKGSKKVYGFSQSPKNLATHSYTVQYIINMNGDILPKVFICLQEQMGKLGPLVQREVEESLPSNIFLTCSKSGKLSTSLNEYFLENFVAQNITDNFLWIVDSWPGHVNISSYDRIFGEINGRPEIKVKVIPEKCTPFLQPLDTTFHRQLKLLAKKILAALEVFVNVNGVHSHDNWTTRKGILRLQSLLHFQLSAPIFKPMIQYSWYSSGLCENKVPFKNVNEVCFLENESVSCNSENCEENSFICCSHCRLFLCIQHFWLENHFDFCRESPFL